MVKLLLSTQWAKHEVKKLLWIKKHQPVKYAIISFLTDAAVMAFFVLTSLGVAVYATLQGYTTFDSALMGVAIIDMNVLMLSFVKFDITSPDD